MLAKDRYPTLTPHTKLQAAVAGRVLVGTSVGLLASLHVLEPDISPTTRFVSEYALSNHSALMAGFFVTLGIGSFALTLSLRRHQLQLGSVQWLYLWSATTLIAGLCTTDSTLPGRVRTLPGLIHDVAATAAFFGILMNMLASKFRAGKIAFAVGVSAFAAASAFGLPGIGERAFLGVALLWLVWLPQLPRGEA